MPRSRYGVAAALAGAGLGAYVLVVRGALTLDLGVGRSIRPLGPLSCDIAAPRELVFDVVSEPYLGRTPRAVKRKLHILERSEGMALAEHYTQVGPLVAKTIETIRFERPERVHFRLLRGPVPYVVETFDLHETNEGTRLVYSGALGTDLWALGRLWAAAAARVWETTVRASLETIRDESERRASRRVRQPPQAATP